jgi:hypothetical protein
MQLYFFDEANDEAEEARRWYRERSETAEAAFLRENRRPVIGVNESR